nr:hypothetical protein Iba_chr07bCG7960 [Ipomoea batatas]
MERKGSTEIKSKEIVFHDEQPNRFETSKDEDLLHQKYWKSMETQGYCPKEYISKLTLIMNVNINGTI